MTVLQAIIFGIIQGIAEFLPISSSGHLALAHNFFKINDDNGFAFDIFLHLATLIAVCAVYHKDVWLLIKGFFTLTKKLFTGKIKLNGKIKQNFEYGEKLFLMLVIASIPLIPAALIEDKVEYISEYSWIIGVLLIINGGMLYISDKLSKNAESLENCDYQKPFYIGLFQLFGILPGISRSGSTITGGLFFGLNRQDAVKFSFLMSIPAILGACILKADDIIEFGLSGDLLMPYLAGAVTAMIVGFFAIKILQFIARKNGLSVFSIYCFIVGITAVVASILM